MDRKRKQELVSLFEAPTPVRKREFLRNHRPEKINMRYMLLTQFAYISKWTWVFFFLLLGVSILVSFYLEQTMIRMIYAFIPFLVMISIVEIMKSNLHGMSELEMACRFSIKSIVLARMSIIGLVTLILLILMGCFIGGAVCRNLIYMLVPYLITAYGGLCIVRKVPNREGTYLCGGVACFISLTCFVGSQLFEWIYEMRYFGGWLLILILFLLLTVCEGYRTIRRTEELVWN